MVTDAVFLTLSPTPVKHKHPVHFNSGDTLSLYIYITSLHMCVCVQHAHSTVTSCLSTPFFTSELSDLQNYHALCALHFLASGQWLPVVILHFIRTNYTVRVPNATLDKRATLIPTCITANLPSSA